MRADDSLGDELCGIGKGVLRSNDRIGEVIEPTGEAHDHVVTLEPRDRRRNDPKPMKLGEARHALKVQQGERRSRCGTTPKCPQ